MKKTLALRLTINDGKPVVGGADDLCVLSAMVTLNGALGPETVRPKGRRKAMKPDIDVRLGGLTSRPNEVPDEHLEWLKRRSLKVGDRVLIEVLETAKAGRIVSRSPSHGKSAASDGRAFYEQAKAIYFELKKKYEPES